MSAFCFRSLFLLEMNNYILVKYHHNWGVRSTTLIVAMCYFSISHVTTSLFIHSTHTYRVLLHTRYWALLMVLFTKVRYFPPLFNTDFMLKAILIRNSYICIESSFWEGLWKVIQANRLLNHWFFPVFPRVAGTVSTTAVNRPEWWHDNSH